MTSPEKRSRTSCRPKSPTGNSNRRTTSSTPTASAMGAVAIRQDHRRSGVAGKGLSADAAGGPMDDEDAAKSAGRFAVCRPAAQRVRRRRMSLRPQAPHRRLRSVEPARNALHGRGGPVLGKDAEAKELLAEAADYRKAIDAALKRTGVDYFPPSWEKDGTFWGNTETLWPTELFAVDDPRVTATIRQAREVLGGGFTEGTIHWVGCRKTPSTPTCRSIRRWLRWPAARTNKSSRISTGICCTRPPRTHFRKGSSQAAVRLGRHDSARDRSVELCDSASPHARSREGRRIAPAGRRAGLVVRTGEEIRVENAPTHFGPMSLLVRGTPAGVEVQLTKPVRNPPKRIVLHLPSSRPLIGTLAEVDVVVRPDQQTRWDFPTIVKKYQGARRSDSISPFAAGRSAAALVGSIVARNEHTPRLAASRPEAARPAAADCWRVDLRQPARSRQTRRPLPQPPLARV